MGNNILLKVILFNITLIILFIVTSSQQVITNLGLDEGELCGRGPKRLDYVCVDPKNCNAFKESIETRNYLDICKFIGLQVIVCCPGKAVTIKNEFEKSVIEIPKTKTVKSISANEKCDQYHKTLSKYAWPYLVGAEPAKIEDYPHMALIGYGITTTDSDDWRCGGSLISERWILTAAHCFQLSSGVTARWARLGVTYRRQEKLQDYRIVEHIVHPDYKPPSQYNDIALFRLERDVEFDQKVSPICLNTDQSSTPLKQISTGWGRTSTAGPVSDVLLQVYLDIFPTKTCNESYFSENNSKLQFGILTDSMICAGSVDGERDTCQGDSGGPLQTKHVNYSKMYTQYGITSFGKFCGDKDTPGIYTRVSNYVSWIEKIAF